MCKYKVYIYNFLFFFAEISTIFSCSSKASLILGGLKQGGRGGSGADGSVFVSILRCDSGYKGPQCDETQDFNILYVVPSGQKLHYVLIAAIIGAVQIAIIVAVVMCITR